MALRQYQSRAAASVREKHAAGARAVCLVAPTGAGKTTMARELSRGRTSAFIVHRRDLVRQVSALGVWTIVDTIQGLARSGRRPDVDLLIFDECHTVGLTPEWRKVAEDYKHAKILGLTATPERGDGSPLGDLYDDIVIAASYSELIDGGYLTPCRVYRPDKMIERGLAKDPVLAWQAIAEPGEQGFVYGTSVKHARVLASAFSASGIRAAVVHGAQPAAERAQAIIDFESGRVTILTNVYCLVEGIDVPQAAVCMIARGCEHAGTYIQMAGRVLRPHESKRWAKLIDLTGCSHKHGLPTADRDYSLSGTAITQAVGALSVCPRCGLTHEPAPRCPGCGYESERKTRRPVHIYSLELREVYDGKNTPADAKRREWMRLTNVYQSKGWSLSWGVRQWRLLFPGDAPPIEKDQLAVERSRLRKMALEKGYKPGWVYHRMKELVK